MRTSSEIPLLRNMAGLKRSTTLRDYTSFVDDLKSDLVKLHEDMKLQIYNQYPAFVDAFSTLLSFSPPQTKPYELCLDSLQSLYDEIQSLQTTPPPPQASLAKGQHSEWEEKVEELEAFISEKRYTSACDLIEAVGKMDSAVDAPKSRLNFDIQALRLVDTVAGQLANLESSDIRGNIAVLDRLKARREAEEAFFVGKSRQLRGLVGKIEGKEARERVGEVAKVFFTMVRETGEEAGELLSDTTGVYFWAFHELKYVSSLIGDSLFLLDDLPALIAGLSSVHAYSSLLEPEGISLTADLDRCLAPYLYQFFGEFVGGLKAGLEGKVRGEIWKQQVVQLHVENEVMIVRLSATCAGLHRDIVSLFDTCAQLLPTSPLLACDLIPKVLSLVQSLLLAYLNCKALSGKKKMGQLIVVCCDIWNLCGVVKEAQWKLESLFETGSGTLFDASELVSTIKGRFRSELTEFFTPLYTERVKTYLSSLEPLSDPSPADSFLETKCEELLSVLKEMHSTLSSSTDHNAEACSLLVDTITGIWAEKLDGLMFENYGYWSVDSNPHLELKAGGIQHLVVDFALILLRAQELNSAAPSVAALRKKVEDRITARIGIDIRVLMFSDDDFKSIYHRMR